MPRFVPLLLGLALALPSLASAQNAPGECSQARDPARCAARQQAQLDCKDQRGRAKQQCLLDKLPPPDCSQAEDRQRCEMRQQARAACQGKAGKELRACLREHGAH